MLFREDQWEDREHFIKKLTCPVILDCTHTYRKNVSEGRANFLTFSLGLERVLGQKLAINLFPIVDFAQGKILVIKPFSVYEVEDNKPEFATDLFANPDLEESVWNFYDSSRRPSMQLLSDIGKLEPVRGANPDIQLSGSEIYQFKKNQEEQLVRQMVGKLRENYPPKDFFRTKFVKQNFILIPGISRKPKGLVLSQLPDDLQILRKMSSFMDDFVPISPDTTSALASMRSDGSEFVIKDLELESISRNSLDRRFNLNEAGTTSAMGGGSSGDLTQKLIAQLKFAFNDPLITEKLNDNSVHHFLNILPVLFTKFCAKHVGTYNRLFKCHPVELFKLVSRAILVKDLSSLVNTNPKEINLFPDFATMSERLQQIVEEYTQKSQNPRLLLDEYFRLRDEYNKLLKSPSDEQPVVIRRAELAERLDIIRPFKIVFEDMNISLNLVHFMKTQLENGNCLIMLGSPKQLHYVRAVKGTNRQVEDMYIILENYEKKEFVFSFDLHKYHYVYFVYLHSSLTLDKNKIYEMGMEFFSET